MDEVYVVEIATTGSAGAPRDAVAEVAVCRMLADGSDFDTVFDSVIALDPRNIGKDALDFLSEEYEINAEDLYAGEELSDVVSRFQGKVFGRECTSYNVGAVFGKHLNFEPWDCTRNLTVLPSISIRLDSDLKGPPEREHALIREAYERMCPGDPACVGGGRRAVHLAQMAVSVLMRLRHDGWF